MKLNNLQILRGISALLVCCFHFRGTLNFDANQWGSLLFDKGGVGVPIFFVISGYIMVFSTRKITHDQLGQNIVSFLKKRIIRIIPLYYFLTLLWMIVGGSFLLYFEGTNFRRLLHSLLFLPQKDQFPVLYLGWSLNYEMFFYFIFALSLLFKKFRYLAVISFFSCCIIFGLFWKPANSFLVMVTSLLNLYFIAGIFLGLYLHKITFQNNISLFISAFSILLFSFYFFQIISISSQWVQLIPVTLFVAAFLNFDLFLKVKANRFLKMLGDISYSIYLSHPFVEIVFRRFQPDSVTVLVLLFILKLAVVIFVSKILYEIVEKRLTAYLKRKLLSEY